MDINPLRWMRNMSDEDITNKSLGGFLSIEFLVAIVMGAIAWGNTTANVEALEGNMTQAKIVHQEDMNRANAETKELRKDIGEIKESLSSIRVNQQYFTNSIQEQKEQTQKILEILRERVP
jgi:hypothetical protein